MVKIHKNFKMYIIFVAAVIIFCILGIYHYEEKNRDIDGLSKKQKIEDFDYMYDVLKNNYVYFDVNKRVNGYDWLSHKKEFEKEIKKTRDNVEFFNALKEILNKLNDKHTNVLNPHAFYNYIELYENNQEWLSVLKKSNKQYLKWKKVLPSQDTYDNQLAESKNYETKILENGRIAYLKIKSMDHNSIGHDKKEINKFFYTIKSYPYLIIDIMDNRGGDGEYWKENIMNLLFKGTFKVHAITAIRGDEYSKKIYDSVYGKQNAKSILTLPQNFNYPPELKKDFKYYYEGTDISQWYGTIGFRGKVYLLVDNRVFSAAEAFAYYVKSEKCITLVGDRTLGDGLGTDPLLLRLPNSGLIIRFSGEMGLNPDGSSNAEKGTEPDIKVEKNNIPYDEYEKKVLQATINMIDKVK